MTRKTTTVVLVLLASLLGATAVYAATGLFMKCQAEAKPDPATGKPGEACGFKAQVTFGSGRGFEQIMGYCRSCRKFVYVRWMRGAAPGKKAEGEKPAGRPDPLGEVWDASTGEVLTVHACPHCKGPFLEIKTPAQLKHCPACNEPHFAVDKTMPKKAVD